MPKYYISNYEPHTGQSEYHDSDELTRIIIASIRSGKSYSVLHDIIIESWNNPSNLPVLIVTPTNAMTRDIMMKPLVELLISMNLLEPKNYNKSEQLITLRNGNTIIGRSHEAAEKIRGLTIYAAYMDEVAMMNKNTYDIVMGRMITENSSNRMTLTGTPKGKQNWLYEYFFKNGNLKNTSYHRFHILQNPIISIEAYEALKETYDELTAKQELEGLFVDLYESLVYRSYSNANLFTNNFNKDYQLYAGIDWNVGINGCVIAIKINDVIYIIDEIYGCKDITELGHEIIKRYGYDLIISSDAMGSQSHRQILRNMGLNKIVETKSNPRRVNRYNNVNSHLKNANGNIKLYIEKKCRYLVEDLENLTFKNGTDVPDTRNEQYGHISDALGYLLEFISPFQGKDIIDGNKGKRKKLKDILKEIN